MIEELDSVKLLSCPFCGGEAKVYWEKTESTSSALAGKVSVTESYVIGCGNLGCGTHARTDSQESLAAAVAIWNTRSVIGEIRAAVQAELTAAIDSITEVIG